MLSTIQAIYRIKAWNSDERNDAIRNALARTDLRTDEVNKYTFWDSQKAYTRNLIHTDGENYTLILLCWNAGRESSIHNHPCEGCFIKTVRGCIKETRYVWDEKDDEIRQTGIRFFNEGQVSFMHDSIGLHKINNPLKDSGSVTLHLYTPPFKSCRAWAQPGPKASLTGIDVKMGYFSVMGHRTPNLEGKPGLQVQLLAEIPTQARRVLSAVGRSRTEDMSVSWVKPHYFLSGQSDL